MEKRLFFVLLLLLVSYVGAAAAEKPNFLLILVDDMGFSDLGCYGGEIDTPQLDALAAGGLRYTQFYNTGRCWPTRASILSGYYPHQIHRDKLPDHAGGNRGRRQEWAKLLPDYLNPLGYRSYHSGKWHIDGPVLAAGFHRSRLVNNQGDFFTNAGNRLNDRPYPDDFDANDYYCTEATADHAIECLRDHQQHYEGQPFFHYLAFIAPHFPLHARQSDIDKYRDRYLGGWEVMRQQRYERQQQMDLLPAAALSEPERDLRPPYDFPDAFERLGAGEVKYPLHWDELTAEQRRFQATKMAIHAAMIDRMDREIGRVVDQLKAMGEFENTVIFFASDNGASAEIMVRSGGHDPSVPLGSSASYLCLGPGFSTACNTPFRKHKTWVHEGGTATPLIVHWPEGISDKGALRRTAGHVIDIPPTIIELAAAQRPADWPEAPIAMPGQSLVPTLAVDTVVEREHLWWYHDGHRAIRQGDWKLVSSKNQPWELYHLATDRSEIRDLAGSEKDRLKALQAAWNQHLARTIEFVSESP